MKQKLNINRKAQKVLNWGMWIIILLFLILGSAIATEAKAEPVKVEVSGKNPELKAYHKKQRKMSFKGFKKRKGKYKIR
jgi:hypothetical protein